MVPSKLWRETNIYHPSQYEVSGQIHDAMIDEGGQCELIPGSMWKVEDSRSLKLS